MPVYFTRRLLGLAATAYLSTAVGCYLTISSTCNCSTGGTVSGTDCGNIFTNPPSEAGADQNAGLLCSGVITDCTHNSEFVEECGQPIRDMSLSPTDSRSIKP